MLYRIKNTGEARTVDFLAVFGEGEEKEFTQQEIDNFQHMFGVKLAWALPENFELIYISGEQDPDHNPEADALAEQEKNLAKLNAMAVPGNDVEEG